MHCTASWALYMGRKNVFMRKHWRHVLEGFLPWDAHAPLQLDPPLHTLAVQLQQGRCSLSVAGPRRGPLTLWAFPPLRRLCCAALAARERCLGALLVGGLSHLLAVAVSGHHQLGLLGSKEVEVSAKYMIARAIASQSAPPLHRRTRPPAETADARASCFHDGSNFA